MMTITWAAFTPWSSLLGGLTIGLATAIYILGNGRVAGIAGIVAGPLRALVTGARVAPEVTQLLFVGGLMLAPWLWRLVAPLPASQVDVKWFGVIAAGLLVGVGVRMAMAAPAATVCAA